jgi:hypothetical protein
VVLFVCLFVVVFSTIANLKKCFGQFRGGGNILSWITVRTAQK